MRSRSISPVSSLESRPDSKLRRWSKPTVTTLKPFHSSSGVSEDSDASDSNDSFQESQDYSTDFTTPSLSRLGGDDQDRDCDDVEAFRDREYPQLKGKVYLDHGGTTVCVPLSTFPWSTPADQLLTALCQIPHRRSLRGSHQKPLRQPPLLIDPLRRRRPPYRCHPSKSPSFL